MGQLITNTIGITNITSNLLEVINDEVIYVTNVSGIIQREDYINLNGYIAFLQNLTRTEYTHALDIPTTFGLPNQDNIEMVTLQIDY